MKLKNLWLLMPIIGCLSGETVRAGNAVITLTDGLGNPLANEQTVISFFSTPQNFSGGTAVQWRNTYSSGTNGVITLTNAMPGNWQVRPTDYNAASFSFWMPVTNGTIYVQNWGTALPGNTLPGGSVAWDIFTSDLRYASQAALTNAVLGIIQPGTNILAITNGNGVIFNVPTTAFDPPGAAAAVLAVSITNGQPAVSLGAVSVTQLSGGGISGSGANIVSLNPANFQAGQTSTSNNWVGTFTGTGGGLNGINGSTAIIGPIVTQSGATLTIQTNGASPFANLNWTGISDYPGAYEPQFGYNNTPYGLTNCPYFQINCGYPTNFGFNGGFPLGLQGWADGNNQTPEIRLKISALSSQIAVALCNNYSTSNNTTVATIPALWYSADGSPFIGITNLTINQWSFSGYYEYLTFTFPNFAVHKLEVHDASGGILYVGWPATNSILLQQPPQRTGIIFGDSITDDAAGLTGLLAWPAQLENLLESRGLNFIAQGEGGTGYVTPGSFANFLTRLPYCVTNFAPSFVVYAGGVNDPAGTNPNSVTNALYMNATNCFGIVKNALPNCKQIVIGAWPSYPAGGGNNTFNQNIILSNAAAAYGLPITFPSYDATTEWVTASNTATYIQLANEPHPNAFGAQFYALQAANFCLTNILTNAVPLW